MAMLDFLGKLAGGVVAPVTTYMTRRAEIKAQMHQNRIDLLKAEGQRAFQNVSEGRAADAAWELESLRAHAGGWKDEFVLLVLAIPLPMCFVPGWNVYVERGFEALAKTPWWYQTALLSVFLATYGIRWWRRQQSDT
jgi:hypothetical protein